MVVDNRTGQPTVRTGYPRPLASDWSSLSAVNSLDAALYIAATFDDTAHLYLFKVSIATH